MSAWNLTHMFMAQFLKRDLYTGEYEFELGRIH